MKELMMRIMERTVFNQAQLQILDLLSRVDSEKTLNEIRDLLANYFARKAEEEIDALWESGRLNEQVLEEWKHEHMRTPYK